MPHYPSLWTAALLSLCCLSFAQPYKPSLDPASLQDLAYTLNGVSAFPELGYSQPLYFCRFVDTPVKLAPENDGQLLFQKLEGVMGISRLPGSGLYQLQKLANFQVVNKDGSTERRSTRRLQRFAGPGHSSDGKFVLESDEKAEGSSEERLTRLELDPSSGKGTLALSLWKGAKSDGPPYFVQTYNFVFQEVRQPESLP